MTFLRIQQKQRKTTAIGVFSALANKLPVPGSADCYTCCAQYGTTAKTTIIPYSSDCYSSYSSSTRCSGLREALLPSSSFSTVSSAWCYPSDSVNNPTLPAFVHCFGDDAFES